MIRRLKYLFILVGVLPIGLNAQGFNRNINDGFKSALGSVLHVNDTYFCDGIVWDGSFSKKKLFAFNEDGDTLFTKTYGLDSSDYATTVGKSLVAYNDKIYSIGNRYESGYAIPHLFITNYLGDSLLMKELVPYDSTVIQSIQIDSNKDLIITGSTTVASGNWQMTLFKLDTLGNVKWVNFFGGGALEHGYSVDTVSDGGYIMSGYTNSYGAGSWDVYVVKTDSGGIFQWHKYFGSIDNDAGWIKSLPNEEYLVFGGNYVTGYTEQKGFLRKINKFGNPIWHRNFINVPTSSEKFYSLAISPDNMSYVMAGILYDPSINSGNPVGYIIRTDTTGNQIYYRLHQKSNNDNYITDLILTDDNYILCSGYLFTDGVTVLNQDGWLLKLDSLGCVVSGCAIGVDELPFSDFELLLYPNPTSGQINLDFLDSEFHGHVMIQDAMGRIILQEEINQSTTSIDLSNQPKGLYFLTVNDGQESSTLKLVVE